MDLDVLEPRTSEEQCSISVAAVLENARWSLLVTD